MTILTKSDFLNHYDNKGVSIEFDGHNVNISNIKDWDLNKEIQQYVTNSENCFFISLELKRVEIRLESN